MARILNPNDKVEDYKIVRVLNRGGMAISYEAFHPTKGRVFFKQYKSPSPTVDWYEAYKRQQNEIKKRITSPEVGPFCCRLEEFFEATAGGRCYFQVFEFIEGGGSLQTVIDTVRAEPETYPWEKRLILARRLLAGLQNLHSAGVVHCDLKPANVQLVNDKTITAGFVLKLIDMDFSILSGKRAAWEGATNPIGFVGSPNYFSPEHIQGKRPDTASDIFTAGLILYEMLGAGHPYASEDDTAYSRAALSWSAKPPRLAGSLPPPLTADAVADALHRCLCPDPARRPAAAEVLATLRTGPAPVIAPATAPAPTRRMKPRTVAEKPAPTTAPSPEPAADPTSLRLVHSSGRDTRMTVRTDVGLPLLRRFGDDSHYAAEIQFTVEPSGSGSWTLIPGPGTKNETLLNGHTVRGPIRLKNGDIISVGREYSGASRLPLTVGLGK